VSEKVPPKRRRGRRRRGPIRTWTRRIALVGLCALLGYFAACTLLLFAYRRFDPPTTGVQIQRRIESLFRGSPYRKRYEPVPYARISPHLAHAVIAAEDTRFFEHGGIDWQAVSEALEDARRGRPRGGSTLSQQLAKNLFLTTHSRLWRKTLEIPLTYLTEWVLTKERILELYLNVAEWGPEGVFGAEAAARRHYGVAALALTREQAARLAACLPAPRRRVPQRMDRYASILSRRMAQMGW
jgi:monofunctional biosynthetic peptidoglycan transglycosylase